MKIEWNGHEFMMPYKFVSFFFFLCCCMHNNLNECLHLNVNKHVWMWARGSECCYVVIGMCIHFDCFRWTSSVQKYCSRNWRNLREKLYIVWLIKRFWTKCIPTALKSHRKKKTRASHHYAQRINQKIKI